tara:strand:+ start:36 stop:542 length:507 start_codon:yes stop_codon:yes gene_type:complete
MINIEALKFSRDRRGSDEEQIIFKNLQLIGTFVSMKKSVRTHPITPHKFTALIKALNQYFSAISKMKNDDTIDSAWRAFKQIYKETITFIGSSGTYKFLDPSPPPGWIVTTDTPDGWKNHAKKENPQLYTDKTGTIATLEDAREIYLSNKLSEFRLLLRIFKKFIEKT